MKTALSPCPSPASGRGELIAILSLSSGDSLLFFTACREKRLKGKDWRYPRVQSCSPRPLAGEGQGERAQQ